MTYADYQAAREYDRQVAELLTQPLDRAVLLVRTRHTPLTRLADMLIASGYTDRRQRSVQERRERIDTERQTIAVLPRGS